MASDAEQGLKKRVAKLEAARRKALLYVQLIYDVCERTIDGEDWRVARTVVDIHVLINRITGDRITLKHDDIGHLPREQVRRFFALTKNARSVPIRSTVTAGALESIQNEESRVVAMFGGQRGMKTQSVAQACVRQWALKGGKNARALWVAPELQQTQIAVDKLCRGEDDLRGLFPPELIAYYPEKHTVSLQYIRLIDGTKIDLKHASDSRKGGNIKGRGYRWICADELCEFRSLAVWRVMRGRVNKRGGHLGQIFVASTPMPGHWAYSEIVLPIDSGAKPTWTYSHHSQFDNVFIPLSEAESALEDAGGADDPYAQREVLGLWSFHGSRLWYRFDPEKHVQSFDKVEDLGLRNVSDVAISKLFGAGVLEDVRDDVLGGQDFNLVPCSTVIAKVCVPKGEKSNAENWVLVLEHEFLTRNAQDTHGDVLAASHGQMAVVCDSSGAQQGHSMRLGDSGTEALELEAAGHAVRASHYHADSLEPYNPPQLDSLRVLHKLMREGRFFVHLRCKKTITAYATQEATPRGTIDKEPGKASDKLSGPTDAARYLAWPLFNSEIYALKRKTG